MTLLQYIIFEILFLTGIKFLNWKLNPFQLLVFLYPIWIVTSFLFCLEVIPYRPDIPRFNGIFDTFSDYFYLTLISFFGLFVVLGIAYFFEKVYFDISYSNLKLNLKILIFIFLTILTWGWTGIYNTPNSKYNFFIKSNPTFKLTFATKFYRPITWEEKDALKSVAPEDLNEEIKFMQYVSNKGNWK